MHSLEILMPLAFAVAVNAVQFTNPAFVVAASQPFNITWSGNTGPVTILLKTGEPSDLKTAATLVSNAPGNSFVWTPSGSVPSNAYTLEIDDTGSSDMNYSPQFEFAGSAPTQASQALPSAIPATSVASTTSMTDSMTESMTDSMASSTSVADLATIATSMTNSSATSSAAISASSSASNLTMTGSSEHNSATKTGTRASTATGTKITESATPIKSGDSKGAAGRLARPVSLVLFACGVLASFH